VILWHDGDPGSSRDALTAVAVRAFLIGMALGFARGLLAQREPRQTCPAARTARPAAPRDLRPWDDTPVTETLDLELMTVEPMTVEPMTVGRTR
jgi:hypothetical protein